MNQEEFNKFTGWSVIDGVIMHSVLGVIHNEDGPAIFRPDGFIYVLNDNAYTKEFWQAEVIRLNDVRRMQERKAKIVEAYLKRKKKQ